MSIIDRIRGTKGAEPKGAPKTPAKKTASKKKAEDKSEATTVVSGPVKNPELLSILRGPRVSEKAARSSDKGVYVFTVALNAEKIAIRKAIEAMYKVNVVSVRTIRVKGKPVNRGRRVSARSDMKKAIVALKSGQTINLYEGV